MADSDPHESRTVGAGKELSEKLKSWLESYGQHRLCAIGFNNYTRDRKLEAASTVVLFMSSQQQSTLAKQVLVSLGAAGIASYKIENSDQVIVCLWSIPISWVRYNWFNIEFFKAGTPEKEMWEAMYKEAQKATDGDKAVENRQIGIGAKAHMDDAYKAMLVVDVYNI